VTGVVVDTCVVIHMIRDTPMGKRCMAALRHLRLAEVFISAATKAELRSFAVQHSWGAAKMARLETLLGEMACQDIRGEDEALMAAYVWADAFSKRKVADANGRMLEGASRKMGKNDLWIAATALALDLPLMTADGDFDHLRETLLEVVKVG